MAETTETKKTEDEEGKPGAGGTTQGGAVEAQRGEGGQKTDQPAAGDAAKPPASATDQQAPKGQETEKPKETQPPATQAKGIEVKLTQTQVDRLVKDGVLELGAEQYTGAVQERMATLTTRAKTAERQLKAIADAQEEVDRKALVEQEKYKELYEKERKAREKGEAARKDDAIRARFLLAAQTKGIVDPDVAWVIAKGLPAFKAVEADDEGAIAGLDEVVEALISAKPYLISQQAPKPQTVGAVSNPAQQVPVPPKNLAEAGDALERALRTGVT